MSDRIKLELSQADLNVQPGASTQVSLTVHNTSAIVDQYAVRVDGLDPAWLTISPSSVSLFPGDNATVTITISPPASAESAAGAHPFTIVATSQDNPAESTQLEANLVIRPFGDFSFAISPEKVIGRQAKYKLALANSSNADIPLAFAAQDEEEALDYDFEWERISVPAGGSVEVALKVRPKRARLTGGSDEHHIRVRAVREGYDEEEPASVEADFEYHPRFGMLPKLPTAKWYWLFALVPIFAILFALPFLKNIIDPPPPTATPAATPSATAKPTAPPAATPTIPPVATPVPVPAVGLFNIERDGANYIMVWEVTGADQVTIDGASVDATGKKALGALTSREIELKATNAGGTVTRRVALVVMPPPTIKSFTASPDTVKPGDTTTLSWEATNAKKATIDGTAVGIPKGKVLAKPEQTRDYVLIVENDVGWVVQRVHVNVIVP